MESKLNLHVSSLVVGCVVNCSLNSYISIFDVTPWNR